MLRLTVISAACIAALTASAAPVRAQSGSIHVDMHASDSIMHVVSRESTKRARFSIVNRDGTAALLLMDTTIVVQMTERGLDSMKASAVTDTMSSVTMRLFAKMAFGALMPLLDHGFAYHLRDLAEAEYADGRLQLRRANGEEVFQKVEMGHGKLMQSFSPDDARAFAKKALDARHRMQSTRT